MKKVICALLFVSMLVSLCGCTKTPYEAKAKQIVGCCDYIDFEEKLPDEKFKSVTADFAMELFTRTYKEGENSLVSPVSVMFCLGMVGCGASEDTLEEFEAVLGQELTMDELNQYYATYKSMLIETSNEDLSIANSIWVRDLAELNVKTEFIRKNETYYKAQIYQAPFDGTTVKDINHWVNENTKGMIPTVINELPPDALMVLVNALAFEGEWVKQYESTQVGDMIFNSANGKTADVKGLRGFEYAYIEDDNTTGFMKEYTNGYKLVVFLPDEGVDFEEYVTSFTGEKYLGLIHSVKDEETFTLIPKFTYDYEVNLNNTLEDMGLTTAFDYKTADFSAMYEENEYVSDVYISEVIHKTHIELGEKGTKAGAVTAVVMTNGATAGPPDYKKVICDRPFVYAIVDGETRLPVFIGSISTIS